VHVKLNMTIKMYDVRVQGEVGQTSVCLNGVLIVDLVRWAQIVPARVSDNLCLLTFRKRCAFRKGALGVRRGISSEPWGCVDIVVWWVWRSTRLEFWWEARDLARLRAKSRARRRETAIFRRLIRVVGEVVEVSSFVHIDPKSIDINASVGVKEREELIVPVFLNVRVEPVREGCNSGPDHTTEISSVLLNKQALVTRSRKCIVGQIVVLLLLKCYRRINHNDVMLVVVVQIVNNIAHPRKWKSVGIQGHYIALVHVIDVGPHRLERNSRGRVVRHDLCNSVEIAISVTTLVQAKAPVGHHNG
jgi:hypothetical protein